MNAEIAPSAYRCGHGRAHWRRVRQVVPIIPKGRSPSGSLRIAGMLFASSERSFFLHGIGGTVVDSSGGWLC